MRPVISFLRSEPVLAASACLAAASMLLTPPSAAYAAYVDWNVLALLFCLMAVVAGFQSLGLFDLIAASLVAKVRSLRALEALLVGLCFFSSMLVTNDVALITFVPLTLAVMGAVLPKAVIPVVVLETIAANLGSMATPVGNPQNIFLFARYALSIGAFERVVLPLVALGGALLAAAVLLVSRGRRASPRAAPAPDPRAAMPAAKVLLFCALFACCLLAVLRLVPTNVCFFVVLAALFAFSRDTLRRIDYALLATFACFFLFVGNIGAARAVREGIGALLCGRELLVSALLSQFVSNVPAALMLAPFTDEAAKLLAGVNVGGLGTPLASLASLISFKLYAKSPHARVGAYLRWFSLANAAFLALCLAAALLLLP